jgi:hypothetical protein
MDLNDHYRGRRESLWFADAKVRSSNGGPLDELVGLKQRLTMADDTRPTDFWQTLPGVLTTVAGVMTTIMALFVFLKQTDTSERQINSQPDARQETSKPSEEVDPQTAPIPGKTLPRKFSRRREAQLEKMVIAGGEIRWFNG